MHTPAPRATELHVRRVIYPGACERISAVRADLRQLLDGCPMTDDVILCASELAANAAVHSRSGLPGGTFTVCVKISPGHYTWIAVEDNGGPWNPLASDPLRPHGLEIVRALASEWGIDGDDNRRTICAKFNWPGDSQRPQRLSSFLTPCDHHKDDQRE